MIYAKLKDRLTAVTVSRIKALILANPASRLGRQIKGKDRKTDVNPLTRGEAKALLETAAEHYPRSYPVFRCALGTRMRLGKLRGLAWGDRDCRGGFIEVRRAFVKGQITRTYCKTCLTMKRFFSTDGGLRTVVLNPPFLKGDLGGFSDAYLIPTCPPLEKGGDSFPFKLLWLIQNDA